MIIRPHLRRWHASHCHCLHLRERRNGHSHPLVLAGRQSAKGLHNNHQSLRQYVTRLNERSAERGLMLRDDAIGRVWPLRRRIAFE